MNKRIILKLLTAAVICLLAIPVTSAIAGNQVEVQVQNEQGNKPRPDLDTAMVELTFADFQSGSAHIMLHSPQRKFFSPTDFPIVEGTELIDAILSVENGKVSFDYMFPIRGDYELHIEAVDAKGNIIGTYQNVINIPENPDEVRNATIFIAILAIFGLITGFGFAKRRQRTHAV